MERIVDQHVVQCYENTTPLSSCSVESDREKSKSLLSSGKAISFFIYVLILALLPQITSAQPCSWFGSSGIGGTTALSPRCNITDQISVGSGTFTYANLVRGARYEISTCGSPFDTQLSIYSGNSGGWPFQAGNNDNGPFCSGLNASVDYTAVSSFARNNEGTHLIVVNRFNCQGHDFTGQSALLRYRQIPPVINSSNATMCAGSTRTLSADQFYGNWAGYGTCDQLTFSSYGLNTTGGAIQSSAGVNGSTFYTTSAPAAWSSGYYSNETFGRNEDLSLYFRYFNSTNTNMMIGWYGNSVGGSYPDMLYAFYFHPSGLQIYEDGNFRGNFTMPGGFTGNIWWECRLDIKAAGCTYYMRRLGAITWQLMYSSGYSSESGIRVGWTQHSGTTNVEGIRVTGPGYGYGSGSCNTYSAGLDWAGNTFSGWALGGNHTLSFVTSAPSPMGSGNTTVQINPNDNAWNDFAYYNSTYTRLANEEITFKYYNGANVWNMIGWHGTDRMSTGNYYENMVHALYFAGDNGFHIYEDGNFRTSFTPPGGASLNTWWEGRIVLKTAGADYYLRRLGSCTWTLVYSGSYSSETNLRAGWTSYGTGTAYIDDIQVQGSTALTTTVLYGQSECTASQSINVNPAPVVSLISNAASACQGTPVTFTACSYTGTFTTVNYTFRLGGTAVLQSGASNTYVSTSNAATSSPGTYNIDVVATSSSGCSRSSNFVTLVVNANPTTSITCSNCISGNIFCFGPGYTATLNANASAGCGSILSYQWYFNGSPVPGGGAQYIASSPGNYQVVVTNNCVPNCSTTSAVFTLVQNPQITVNAGTDRTLCPVPPGNSTTLGGSPTASGGTPGYSYAWSPSTALNSTSSANPTVTNLTTTTNYTVTVTDSRGCTASDNVLVQVVDVTPPSISCVQSSVSVNDNPGVCYATFTPAQPSFSDNCSTPTLTWTLSGATTASSSASGINYVGTRNFNTGVTTVTYTVRDQSNNSATCSYTVTAIDNQNPSLTCPANITQNNDPNVCGAVVTFSGSASDNCPGLTGTFIQGYPSGSTFPVGTTTNIFRVTDASGNTAQCSFTVTVNDVQAPTITCPANITQSTDAGTCSGTVNYTVSASDNCPGVSTTLISGLASGSSFPPGFTTVQWRATDAKGNTSSCSFTVFIADQVPPTITCPSNITTFNSIGFCGANVSYGAPTASDNCGSVTIAQTGGLASGSFFPVGTTTNVFRATDQQGNTQTCSFTVTVIDNKPPTALCKNITVNLSTAGSATIVASDVNNGSYDECGVASLSVNTSSFGCANVGNNTVTLTVTDVNGNTSTCNAIVTVRDVTNPVAVCRNVTVSLSSAFPGTASIVAQVPAGTPANNINNGTSDACGFTLSLSRTSFTCADAFAVSGLQTVTMTATDPSGNTGTCTATVRVNDVTNPTALCKNITIQLDAAGNKIIAHNATDNGSFDNCSVSYSLSKTSYNCTNVGSNNVTLTVTDPTGNTASCNSTVTVQDVTPPNAVCKNITVDLSATGTATTAHNAINNGSTDACGIASFVSSKTSWNCSNVGNNTVTLTVTDVNGNSSTCSGIVTVRDVTPPNAICQNITVQLDASGNVSITAAQVNNGSNDACGVASLAVFPTGFDCSKVGSQQAVLTVTDVNGNQNTCVANVEVQDLVPPVAV
ncbi:MAG TPA: HYR domain-containing protein, partial [Chitinophagales bacterium]|nr:HYR domain-containing protein [Chitinophagales bacterium]